MKTRERASFPEINIPKKQMLTATMVISTRTGRDENNRVSLVCTARRVYVKEAKSSIRILRANPHALERSCHLLPILDCDVVSERKKSVLTLFSEARFHVS